MNPTSAYIVNAILVLLVVRQIREHRMDLRGLAGPVLAVGVAAVFFLRSVPVGGNDLLLELACVAAGAVMGWLSGLFTHLRQDRDGQVLGHAGWVSASLWVRGWAPGWCSSSPPLTASARPSAGSASPTTSPARRRGPRPW
jgi:hypothetical protein